jgi:phosphoribosylformimino-5-aminoimidazole carboxamide ribonucleotide (ProFAR) isomerase
VGSIADIDALKAAGVDIAPSKIEGVVVGRALYDGRISPKEALARAAG